MLGRPRQLFVNGELFADIAYDELSRVESVSLTDGSVLAPKYDSFTLASIGFVRRHVGHEESGEQHLEDVGLDLTGVEAELACAPAGQNTPDDDPGADQQPEPLYAEGAELERFGIEVWQHEASLSHPPLYGMSPR